MSYYSAYCYIVKELSDLEKRI